MTTIGGLDLEEQLDGRIAIGPHPNDGDRSRGDDSPHLRARKKLFQFYETPSALADAMVLQVLPIKAGMRVLEPSAGDGALIDAILRVQPQAQVYALELDPKQSPSAAAPEVVHILVPAQRWYEDLGFT